MAAIDGGSFLRRCPDVRFRIVDGEAVVLRQSSADMLVFNELGGRILDLADGTTPISAWVDQLLEEYEVERAVLEADIVEFAADLANEGILELAPPPAATP
jgi:hypothetical protein